MSIEPVMYALMDVERLVQGLPALQPFEITPIERQHGGSHDYKEPRRRHVQDLARTLSDDLAWLFARDLNDDQDARVLAFDLIVPPELRTPYSAPPAYAAYGLGENMSVSIVDEHQVVLTEQQRGRYVIAEIEFTAPKWSDTFPAMHPALPAMRALLEATLPVHAFVWPDAELGDDNFNIEGFREHAWRSVNTTCFLGPEWTTRLSSEAWQDTKGLAVMESWGQGVWITTTGGYERWNQPAMTDEEEQRHQQACSRLSAHLNTLEPVDFL